MFYDELECPTAEPFSPGENVDQWRERYRLTFQQAIPNHPLLGRAWDIFEYVSYRPEEIAQLRAECVRVQTSSTNEKASTGLAKLISACDEALKLGSGLLFVPD